jgi:hypothetical protein
VPRTSVNLGSGSEVVSQIDAVHHGLKRADSCAVKLPVLNHRVFAACFCHLGVGQQEVLQLANKRSTLLFSPLDAGYERGGRHGDVRIRLVVHIEEGSQGVVGELAVLAVGDYAEELLQALC